MTDNKTLKDIVAIVSQIEESLISSDGELHPDIEPLLRVVQIDLPEKVDGYYMMLERMNYLSEYYDKKAKTFSKFSKTADKIISFCKNSLETAMKSMEKSELVGNDFKFKLQNSPTSFVITDESLIPEAYKKAVTTYVIDKDKIREAKALGIDIPGCEFIQNQHIRSYVNTPGSKRIKE